MPTVDVEARVDLKEVLDNVSLSEILEEVDPDEMMKEILHTHGYEALSDHLTLPQLLRALAKKLESNAKHIGD